jgi:hypothetical protein
MCFINMYLDINKINKLMTKEYVELLYQEIKENLRMYLKDKDVNKE